MALTKALLILVLLAIVTGLSKASLDSSGSPVITSTNLSEIVVNPGESYTITCEGHSPVIWNYPKISDVEPRIYGTHENDKYVSSIQLINITYKDVGYYHCLLNNNREKQSSIYLYVNDTEHLFTHDDVVFSPVHGMQHEDAIIPCKPTHPGVKVTLCRNEDEKLNIGENDDLGVIRYNQKVGFILENARIVHNGFYSCCVLHSDYCNLGECPRTFSLEILKHQDSVARPTIDETHLQHVKVGDNVTMECRITTPSSTKYELSWIIPNESDRITIEPLQIERPVIPGHHLQTGLRKLKIVSAELEDAGNYTCKVVDHERNTNNATIYLNIFNR